MFQITFFQAEEAEGVHNELDQSTLNRLYEQLFQAEKYAIKNYSSFGDEEEFCLRNLHRFFTRGNIQLLYKMLYHMHQ